MRRLWFGTILGIMILCSPTAAFAAQSSSPNYQVNEVQFGAGGLLNATSPNYEAQENLGSTTVGLAKSASYWAEAGYLTPNVPFLQLNVSSSNVNLGTLNSTSAATGTATFSVRAYVDSGYVVESVNNPPQQEDGYYLKTPSAPTASTPGSEQFGINLVQNLTTCANPAPANFGANPAPQPNGSYATGVAASGYNTCGLFKYHPSDVIAQTSGNGWGQTNYTISYIINISAVSPAGSYSMTQNLVVVATF
jgi:hypothetical protein